MSNLVMKKFLAPVLCILIFAPVSDANISENNITPVIVLKAITIFRNNPVGEQADSALSIIVNFAQASAKVLVVVEEKVFPFKPGSIAEGPQSKLVGAFIAGNIEYQLIHRVKENRPYEGIELMIVAYESMRNTGLMDRVEGFEDWIKLRDKGELKNVFEA